MKDRRSAPSDLLIAQLSTWAVATAQRIASASNMSLSLPGAVLLQDAADTLAFLGFRTVAPECEGGCTGAILLRGENALA